MRMRTGMGCESVMETKAIRKREHKKSKNEKEKEKEEQKNRWKCHEFMNSCPMKIKIKNQKSKLWNF